MWWNAWIGVLDAILVNVETGPAHTAHNDGDDDSPRGPRMDCPAKGKADENGGDGANEDDVPRPVDLGK